MFWRAYVDLCSSCVGRIDCDVIALETCTLRSELDKGKTNRSSVVGNAGEARRGTAQDSEELPESASAARARAIACEPGDHRDVLLSASDSIWNPKCGSKARVFETSVR